MGLAIFTVIAGILLLYLGGEGLVRTTYKFALNLGISPLILGVTILSWSTSMPEAVSSIVAQLYGGRGDIALGNIIGSNIANIALVLALAGLARPLKISTTMRKREMPLMVVATILLGCIMYYSQGLITRWMGAFLCLLLVGYILLQIYISRKEKAAKLMAEWERYVETMGLGSGGGFLKGIAFDFVSLFGGTGFLVLGSYFLVDGGVEIARYIGIPERVIGLSIIALGSSSPELATSLVASWKKEDDLSIGNVIGSNIFNILFITGMVSCMLPIYFSKELLFIDFPVMLGFSLLLYAFFLWKDTFSRLQSFVLLAAYAVYMGYLFLGSNGL